MMRFASSLAALFLCGSMLSGCAADNSALSDIDHSKGTSAASGTVTADTDGAIRQVQLARLAGHYDDAIHTLSQLMLVASDDPRVVGEYGKTLAEKGRAQEAIQFLTRATELQPLDWTLYSALGVAYDEAGDQNAARQAYDHALALKPAEPTILNNYALSRMLANDPAMARQLMASAAEAGGASDPKIARNIALVNGLTPKPAPTPVAAAAAPPQAQVASRQPSAAPTPILAPDALPAVPALQDQQPQASQVVMQPVPVDPLAGPVKVHKPKAAKAEDKNVQAADAKPVPADQDSTIPNLRQANLNY